MGAPLGIFTTPSGSVGGFTSWACAMGAAIRIAAAASRRPARRICGRLVILVLPVAFVLLKLFKWVN